MIYSTSHLLVASSHCTGRTQSTCDMIFQHSPVNEWDCDMTIWLSYGIISTCAQNCIFVSKWSYIKWKANITPINVCFVFPNESLPMFTIPLGYVYVNAGSSHPWPVWSHASDRRGVGRCVLYCLHHGHYHRFHYWHISWQVTHLTLRAI